MKKGWQPIHGPEKVTPPPAAPVYRLEKDVMAQILGELKAIRRLLEESNG